MFTNSVIKIALIVAVVARAIAAMTDTLAAEVATPTTAASIAAAAISRYCRIVGLQRIKASAMATHVTAATITTLPVAAKYVVTGVKVAA